MVSRCDAESKTRARRNTGNDFRDAASLYGALNMTVRASKGYDDLWYIEQEFMCVNGLRAWFVIATVDGSDEASMGYTDGAFGTAEERANRIAKALQCTAS